MPHNYTFVRIPKRRRMSALFLVTSTEKGDSLNAPMQTSKIPVSLSSLYIHLPHKEQ